MEFQLCNCPSYVPPESDHVLAGKSPLCGLQWRQNGTKLHGRTLATECTRLNPQTGRRCKNSTTFDFRYCHKCLRDLFSLMVAPTTVPGLKGWGLFAVRSREFEIDSETRRPVRKPNIVVFPKNVQIGGDRCYFVGEYITQQECSRRYPGKLCGDYVIEEADDQLIDGQVARTVLQFSNDALNLQDPKRRRNLPGKICMPQWPVVQNADGILINGHVYLVSLCDICHGDEIFWSYSGSETDGTDYWQSTNHSN